MEMLHLNKRYQNVGVTIMQVLDAVGEGCA